VSQPSLEADRLSLHRVIYSCLYLFWCSGEGFDFSDGGEERRRKSKGKQNREERRKSNAEANKRLRMRKKEEQENLHDEVQVLRLQVSSSTLSSFITTYEGPLTPIHVHHHHHHHLSLFLPFFLSISLPLPLSLIYIL
jgi:hypothetical protein